MHTLPHPHQLPPHQPPPHQPPSHQPPPGPEATASTWTPSGPAFATPYLDLDVGAAVTRFRRLAAALPGTAVHYAVKANPDPSLLAALAHAGCRFDVASPAEVAATLEAGAVPGDLIYSNPVKRRADIESAARLGVRLFAVDSLEETQKVAAAAPGSAVLCRIVTTGAGASWSLSGKFGCSPHQAVHLLRSAAVSGLDAAGISFHVGSQQQDPHAWDTPIRTAAEVLAALGVEDCTRFLLDLGGGFPAHLEGDTPPLPAYGAAIEQSLRRHFGDSRPRTVVEPGRAVVADAGTLVATVVAVVRRGGTRWVYLDAGVFSGLVETLDEAIRYRIRTSRDGGPTGPCVVAGPTCDSADVLYEKAPVELPLALGEGDTVRLLAAGAYTTSCSTVGFNGFPPLLTRHV
jgi:ornithine decarboxylase